LITLCKGFLIVKSGVSNNARIADVSKGSICSCRRNNEKLLKEASKQELALYMRVTFWSYSCMAFLEASTLEKIPNHPNNSQPKYGVNSNQNPDKIEIVTTVRTILVLINIVKSSGSLSKVSCTKRSANLKQAAHLSIVYQLKCNVQVR
jgi:hypothetical protein